MDFLPSFLRAERPSRARRAAQRRFSLPIPFLGRLHVALEKNGAIHTGGLCFGTHLTAVHFRKGKIYDKYDLGSGAVSNVGVAMMANDFTIAGAPTLKEMNYHGVGTGATAAAASDYYLQTAIASGSLTGSTHGYYTGTQSFVSPNIYQSVATITAATTLAVTEWGLFMSNASPFTGRSATATGNNTMTDSGAAFTTSGNALSGWAVEASATAVNTPTTTAWGPGAFQYRHDLNFGRSQCFQRLVDASRRGSLCSRRHDELCRLPRHVGPQGILRSKSERGRCAAAHVPINCNFGWVNDLRAV